MIPQSILFSRTHHGLLAVALPRLWICCAALLPASCAATVYGTPAEQPQPKAIVRDRVAVRLRLGLLDTKATDWSGSAKVAPGRLVAINPWPINGPGVLQGNAWKTKTPRYSSKVFSYSGLRMGETGVILRLEQITSETVVEIATRQGNFRFLLADLASGQAVLFLKGAAEAQRVADTQDLVTTPDEEDFPSAATAADGTVYLAYLAFTPGRDFSGDHRPVIRKEPKEFSIYAEPTGGDRVWLLTLRGSQWNKPVALTDGGEDLYRTATAVDGQGRAWVFFSKNVGAGDKLTGGDWELFARSYQDGKVGPLLQLTHAPGPDIYPAAATDADGRVWVAWQGFRDGQGRIFAARQTGDGFGEPILVAQTAGNAWCPAIAASASQPAEVTIAWDAYAKGDYDVYARTFRGDVAGEPFAVAATRNFEARPAAAYDGQGRLWLAWEETGENWGKDFGGKTPLQGKKGIPLYFQRELKVRVRDSGQWYEPAGDLRTLFPRKPGSGREMVGQQRVSFARMGTDRSGRVWLSGRVWMGPGLYQNWHEFVTYAGATGWAAPIFTAGAVKMLDKRAALVLDPQGGLLLFGSGSGLQQAGSAAAASADAMTEEDSTVAESGSNNNLYVAPLVAAADAGMPQLTPLAAPAVAAAATSTEPGDVQRVRNYRTQFEGKSLRILRGEFHRHTEHSPDGGADGPLEDMWRYGLDAASLDWLGNGDHGAGHREYTWWLIQKTATVFQLPDVFTPMYTYERSVVYPDGHRNIVFAQRGVRPLGGLRSGQGKILDQQMDKDPTFTPPPSPDTQMLYHYLAAFGGICASHTSATSGGTDWRNSDRKLEPIVEIYQGDRDSYESAGAPRAPTEGEVERRRHWKSRGFVNVALLKGIRLGFECSSDHHSTHTSFCNVYVEKPAREEILGALRARHVYGSTDHIVADVRWTAGGREHLMGEEFAGSKPPTVRVHLEGTGPFAKVSIIRDNRYVYAVSPKQAVVDFAWTDAEPKAGTSYYYVRGEQENGELVWVSPVWIDLTLRELPQTFGSAGGGT